MASWRAKVRVRGLELGLGLWLELGPPLVRTMVYRASWRAKVGARGDSGLPSFGNITTFSLSAYRNVAHPNPDPDPNPNLDANPNYRVSPVRSAENRRSQLLW